MLIRPFRLKRDIPNDEFLAESLAPSAFRVLQISEVSVGYSMTQTTVFVFVCLMLSPKERIMIYVKFI